MLKIDSIELVEDVSEEQFIELDRKQFLVSLDGTYMVDLDKKSIKFGNDKVGYMKILPNQTFYVVDLETTGLDTDTIDIIEATVRKVMFVDNKLQSNEVIFNKVFYADENPVFDINHIDPHEGKVRFIEDPEDFDFFINLFEECEKHREDQEVVLAGQYVKFENALFKRFFGYEDICIYDTWAAEKFLRPMNSHNSLSMALRYDLKIDHSKEHRSEYDTDICVGIMVMQRAEITSLLT